MPPEPISIWQPHVQDGEVVFMRPDPQPLGDHYAAQKVLRARKEPGVRRICFFGESVAAGYLYAPHLTPARVLAHQLCAASEANRYDVVDLARTNETLDGLQRTVQQAMQLDPDMLVLFAGNNWNLLETPFWSPYVPSPEARHRLAGVLREEGLWGVIDGAARERVEKIIRTLAAIAEIAAEANIPVVLVIPEVNLGDWETRQPVSWLATTAVTRWHTLYEEAERALSNGEWDEADKTAQQIIDLSDGTSPTGYRLLARAAVGQGDERRALLASRAEVDASHFATLCFLGAPQATTIDQEVQRRSAARYGFLTVDLPVIFERYSGSPLPGRRFFLDYCHLTREGMRVAMAAVTASVLRHFEAGAGATWETLAQELPEIPLDSAHDATAKLGAAIHTSHRLLATGTKKVDLLDYWCKAALDAAPGIEEAMWSFVEAQCAPCPAVLTSAQRDNLESPYRLLRQHGWGYDYLDAAMLEAIERVLAQRGSRAASQAVDLLLRYHAVESARQELLDPPRYLWEPLERFYSDVMQHADLPERACYRSPWPRSGFCLVSEGTRTLALTLIARLPRLPGTEHDYAGEARLSLNGHNLGSLDLHTHWTTHQVNVPRAAIKRGLNRLVIHWPPLPAFGAEVSRAVIACLDRGIEAPLHPIFGELFSVQVQ